MPSLRPFTVEFDRPGATFVPGEIVSGNIIVDEKKSKKIRELLVSAKGVAFVKWTETKTARNGQRHGSNTVHYTNQEEYFHLKYKVTNTNRSNSQIQNPIGYHKYPFSFQLPYNIPSSFEHKYGYIKYTIKAVIDKPWGVNHECMVAFTVVSTLDLNAHYLNCVEIDDDVTHNFCCLCILDQGSMNLHITVPSSGYVPGQQINTTLDYTNSSHTVQITKICVKVVQKLKFCASLPCTTAKTELSEVTSKKKLGPFLQQGQTTINLVLPPIPPSNLEYCSIIHLDYNLVISVHVSGLHQKIQKTYPLLIGTVPLYCSPSAPPLNEIRAVPTSSISEIPAKPSAPSLPQHDPALSPNQPSTSAIKPDIPPPSYEECMAGTYNIQDNKESNYVSGGAAPFIPT